MYTLSDPYRDRIPATDMWAPADRQHEASLEMVFLLAHSVKHTFNLLQFQHVQIIIHKFHTCRSMRFRQHPVV